MNEEHSQEDTAPQVIPRVDPLYLELLTHRVLRSIRASFWTAFAGLLAIVIFGAGHMYYHVLDRLERLEANVVTVSRALSAVSHENKRNPVFASSLRDTSGPVVVGMESPFSEPERLVIVGAAFGSDEGHVELYYQQRSEETQSPGIVKLGGDQIYEWTDSRIILRTTMQQQQEIKESLQIEDFDDVVPYIVVVTADGEQSNVW